MTESDHKTENDARGYGFVETLFGLKVDPVRPMREQAVCVMCGGAGFHAHVIPPAVAP